MNRFGRAIAARKRYVTYTLFIIVLLAGMSGTGRAQTRKEWVRVQNSAQDYTLSVPPSAEVRRYDPEGILHVELPVDQQVLTVRVYENNARLSAEEWTISQFPNGAMRIGDEVGPSLPVVDRRQISVGGQRAESFVIVGPTSPFRQILLVDGERAYWISYPTGQNEALFQQIVATFEAGDVVEDRGLRILEPDSTQAIANLDVPYYSQRDSTWICDQLGTCNCDFNTCTSRTYTGIGDAGCFISSQAMIFEYYTTNHFKNPQEFDACLTNNGGYSSWSGCAYGLCAASYSPPSSCAPSSVSYEGTSTNLSLLDSDLSDGYPAIAWVDSGAHYVVVIGKSGGNYRIHDPYYSRSEISPGEILHFVRYHGPVPTTPEPYSEDCLTPLLSYWHDGVNHHFYTRSWSELEGGSGGWIYERVEGYANLTQDCYAPNTVPFYRFYHPTRNKHFYTASETERAIVEEQGFELERIEGYVLWEPNADYHTVPLYRCYNSTTDDHFYTTDWNNVQAAVNQYGYTYEGIRAYLFGVDALEPPSSSCIKPFLRYRNDEIGAHLYVTDWNQLRVGNDEWHYEGHEGYVAATSSCYAPNAQPIYHYWSDVAQGNFYTLDWSELGSGNDDWHYEGIVAYALRQPNAFYHTIPLYRYWSENRRDHLYTVDWNELGDGSTVWSYEGTRGHVFDEGAFAPIYRIYLPSAMR